MDVKISAAELHSGDILLSTGTAFSSAMIRFGTSSDYSHAALYVGNGELVEAEADGVRNKPLATAMADDTLVVAYRHRALTAGRCEAIASFARNQIGRSFDHFGTYASARTTKWGWIVLILGQPHHTQQRRGFAERLRLAETVDTGLDRGFLDLFSGPCVQPLGLPGPIEGA